MRKKIKSALISVFYKDKLDLIVKELDKLGVKIYSTGGTQSFVEGLGVKVTAVEDLTSYPSILGGRVKTLHPKVFGGILGRRDNESDQKEMAQYEIPEIDLVIVDLYPFEETVKAGKGEEDIIEKIDIGGISLIRAAAKNFNDTIIVSTRNDYGQLLQLLQEKNGESDLQDRKEFAAKAFMTSSHYDTLIFNYFNNEFNFEVFKKSELNAKVLRYGENPHQRGVFYGNLDEIFEILNGKELSYNNLVDVEASVNLVAEFSEPTVAIIKHTNSCGLASRPTISEAYKAAFACDTTSAFGGVIAANRTIDLATANELNSLFFEVLTAPGYDEDALAVLKSKKNRILIKQKTTDYKPQPIQYKSLLNGVLAQDVDNKAEGKNEFKLVTTKAPTDKEIDDLAFAVIAVKHLKSNGIALVKNKQLVGSNCGQTSRVDALQNAIRKAKEFGFDLQGSVMASDAFFPFPDCVQIAHEAGITAISQPGGSIKDQDSIDAANKNNQAMVTTGVRHFKH
ncbi:MAG TPA: bifunctional phosphoribosylaminoimidazolecarboxamide formyltransferase/IMP cyclohydrolase [Chitinophagales bacterium]|nr:bifunctional phosphoribosylaminoimidazolecarboxamide formyltransferase/IMP cyclohydrolase [Chitinophagales bacterium]